MTKVASEPQTLADRLRSIPPEIAVRHSAIRKLAAALEGLPLEKVIQICTDPINAPTLRAWADGVADKYHAGVRRPAGDDR